MDAAAAAVHANAAGRGGRPGFRAAAHAAQVRERTQPFLALSAACLPKTDAFALRCCCTVGHRWDGEPSEAQPVRTGLDAAARPVQGEMRALITSECDAMRVNAHQMALITSECDAMRVHEHQMALITSDCECSVHVAHIDYRPA